MNETRSLSSPYRGAASAALVCAAAAHLPIVPEHFREAPYLGALFVMFIGAAIVLAARLALEDTRRVWTASGALCTAALATFVFSRSVGLPQLAGEVGHWAVPLAAVAGACELAVVGLSIAALRRDSGALLPGRRSLVAGVAVLVTGLGSCIVATPASLAAERVNLPPGGKTRTYYIAADEVSWNYAPDGKNEITGLPFDEKAKTYVQSGADRVGSTYFKCLYRGYTDATFHARIARPAADAYEGILGPVIHAVVGDTVKVVFRNHCSFPTSIHVHGLFYDKASEGAPYNDGTSGADKLDDGVAPGHGYTYTYLVPERSGPGPMDGSSVMWMYHSHTNEVSDTYAGLMGPIVVTRRGEARADGSPKDVDQELFALFSVMDENQSPLLGKSLRTFGEPPYRIDPNDDDFHESNLMHSINGYVFGNMPMITLHAGQRARWYVMSMGTEVDLHTPHWHGNVLTVNGMRTDVVSLLPATMVVADMVPDDPGTWLYHCHVNDHILAGMQTRYRVVP
jgi:hephaestin